MTGFLDFLLLAIFLSWITCIAIRQCSRRQDMAGCILFCIGLMWWLGLYLGYFSISFIVFFGIVSRISGGWFAWIVASAVVAALWKAGDFFRRDYHRSTATNTRMRLIDTIRSAPFIAGRSGLNALVGFYAGLCIPLFIDLQARGGASSILLFSPLYYGWLGACSMEAIGRSSTNRPEAARVCVIGGSVALAVIGGAIVLSAMGILRCPPATVFDLKLPFAWAVALLAAAVEVKKQCSEQADQDPG